MGNVKVLPVPETYNINIGEDEASGFGRHVQLVVRGDGAKAFKRRSIKKGVVNGETCWLVGELDGVRVYVYEIPGQPIRMLMTREDVNP